MSCRLSFLTALVFVPLVILSADPPIVIKKTPVVATPPASGPTMFKEYCAVCHGVDGKGQGPAVGALKTPPPDLTLLARNNNGKFPSGRVQSAIRGDSNFTAHGSKAMPIWGDVFREMATGPNQSEVAVRLGNLTAFIQSLQQK